MSFHRRKRAPGGTIALAAGCRCPADRNRRGRGLRVWGGRLYIIGGDCPQHRHMIPEASRG